MIGAISTITQFVSLFGLFDAAASRVAGRKAEPMKKDRYDRPSTTLIWSRIQFIAGAAAAVLMGVSPMLMEVRDTGWTVTGVALMLSGAITAYQRYKTTQPVQE